MNPIVAQLACLLIAALPEHDPTRRVHDFAQMLPADAVQRLESLAESVEKDTTAQVAVVTIRSLEGRTIEEYATDLFNRWGIGRRDVNNGVLLLVVRDDRQMRIEVGRGLEPLLTDRLCGEIRDDDILPHFRRDEYAAGIEAGVAHIVAILRKYPEAARGVKGSAPLWVRTAKRDALTGVGGVGAFGAVLAAVAGFATRRRNYGSVMFYAIVALALAALGIVGVLIWKAPKSPLLWGLGGGVGLFVGGTLLSNWNRYKRFGPNACKHCGTRLELLSEADDDAKLTEVQQLEEKIGTVDYDVWYCPACLKTETQSYVKSVADFTECPECKARTFKEEPQEILYPSTTINKGRAQIRGACMSCKKTGVRFVMLPRLPSPSSSSGGSSFSGGGGGGGGSSFGGGSSGGGGASGRW